MPEAFIEVKGHPQGPPNSHHTGYLDVGYPQGPATSHHTGCLDVGHLQEPQSSYHTGYFMRAEIRQTNNDHLIPSPTMTVFMSYGPLTQAWSSAAKQRSEPTS